MPFIPSTACMAGLLALLAATGASAQQVYRHVDANGRVSFSDRPPAASTAPQAGARSGAAASSSSGNPALPYELRQVVQRYPVTLYSGDDCAPCDSGRSLLTTRGIPFSERTVKSPEDTAALRRLNGDGSLPTLSIGGQQIKGFSDANWSQYLDAAGYPPSAQLPAGYRNPPAAPLAPPKAQTEQAPSAPAAPGTAAAPSPTPGNAPNPGNPAGIRF